MIVSMGIVLLSGFLAGALFKKISLPALVGMILVGFLIGPYCLSLLDRDFLSLSAVLRQVALVVILTRSGLHVNLASLRKIGRPALLMCFLPATFEIAAVTLAARLLLGLTVAEGLLLGAALAAVSPAVVSPRMISLIEEGYGKKHAVCELILAGSSADDVYVIVLFYAFLGFAQGGSFDPVSLALVPASLLSGVGLGVAAGLALGFLFQKVRLPMPVCVLLFLSVSFLMLGLEETVKNLCGFDVSALLGVMTAAAIVLFTAPQEAARLGKGYDALWTFFEIILFVLVGASVDFSYALSAGLQALAVLAIGLCCRCVGVCLCLLRTPLNRKERLFAVISYLPKATVQASIGGVALAAGLPCGKIVLAVCVLAILVTAPVGAALIDRTGRKWLEKEEESGFRGGSVK